MVSVLDSGSSSSPGRGTVLRSGAKHFTLIFIIASLHPGVKMGSGEFTAGFDYFPIQ